MYIIAIVSTRAALPHLIIFRASQTERFFTLSTGTSRNVFTNELYLTALLHSEATPSLGYVRCTLCAKCDNKHGSKLLSLATVVCTSPKYLVLVIIASENLAHRSSSCWTVYQSSVRRSQNTLRNGIRSLRRNAINASESANLQPSHNCNVHNHSYVCAAEMLMSTVRLLITSQVTWRNCVRAKCRHNCEHAHTIHNRVCTQKQSIWITFVVQMLPDSDINGIIATVRLAAGNTKLMHGRVIAFACTFCILCVQEEQHQQITLVSVRTILCCHVSRTRTVYDLQVCQLMYVCVCVFVPVNGRTRRKHVTFAETSSQSVGLSARHYSQ